MAVAGVNFASFALIFESSALTVALPVIARQWEASTSTQRWIVNASLLTTSLLLLVAGALSDTKGTRRIMRIGLLGAAACSMMAAAAPSPGALITIRLIQGACAALVIPGTLGLLRLLIPDDQRRLRAMTWWSGISIAGGAAGPIAGGLIADAAGWRAIFVLPALLLTSAWWCLRPNRDERASSPAPAAPAPGAARTIGTLSSLIRDRAFLASNVASACVYFAVYGLSFALATTLPASMASSSFRTGLFMAPPAAMMLILASTVSRISTSAGRWWAAAIGAVVCAGGLFQLAAVIERATPAGLFATTAVIGIGFALTLGPLDALMMNRSPVEDSNVASAFGHVSARLAGVSAIAAGGAVEVSAAMALVASAAAGLMIAGQFARWRSRRST